MKIPHLDKAYWLKLQRFVASQCFHKNKIWRFHVLTIENNEKRDVMYVSKPRHMLVWFVKMFAFPTLRKWPPPSTWQKLFKSVFIKKLRNSDFQDLKELFRSVLGAPERRKTESDQNRQNNWIAPPMVAWKVLQARKIFSCEGVRPCCCWGYSRHCYPGSIKQDTLCHT